MAYAPMYASDRAGFGPARASVTTTRGLAAPHAELAATSIQADERARWLAPGAPGSPVWCRATAAVVSITGGSNDPLDRSVPRVVVSRDSYEADDR